MTAPHERVCADCARPARPGGTRCHRCYQRLYRASPEGRQRHNAAVARYNARNPDKRRQWVRTYRQRVGLHVPDLIDLRRAIKRLDAAVATAQERP
jgi:hypothetical protein